MTNERGRTWKLIFGVLMMALCGWSAYALGAEPAPSAPMIQTFQALGHSPWAK